MSAAGALGRVIRSAADRAATAGSEVCELCAARLAGEHRHLYDTGTAEPRCVCGPCSVLFADDTAGRYRLVPRRRLRLPPVDTAVLGVPVGLVFFVPRSDGTVTAQGPSPAGAMRWEVDAAAWRRLAGTVPELASLAPDVEALLVNTVRGFDAHWIVPVDDCYRMIALVRREWRGLSGGGRVWPAVEQFFKELTERS
ncbi:hypothetical protein GCM10010260_27740 [Streptomyces filipinensis]|uniref:Uncharacterized protein n=1 Tax=Streptomyces filipinensis TaxID=66887 RepID=A0A918IBZ2_9ACTN|nr:DUF5947 family protein [Streptomyces filipinensis]GGU91735.1 hypothetical protein GCM10010260_27740 [Streptomyces filipinensis]